MKTINRDELKNLFVDYGRRAVIATIVTKTECKPAAGVKQRVLKRATVNGVFGPRDNERPRPWGTRVAGTGLVEHKGADYVEFLVQNVSGVEYVDTNGCIIEGGETLVRHRDTSEKLRDYKLESILEVRANQEVYRVID